METPETADTVLARSAMNLLPGADTFRVIEFVAGHERILAVRTFIVLQHHFYWKKKDVRTSTAFARAGIQLALTAAPSADAPAAEKLRSAAKGLAYDVGSFNWPGWDEPGVELGAADVAAGLDCARLNLRLAVELKKGDLPLSRAHWLIGAYALARHDVVGAAVSFQTAASFAARCDQKREQLLNVAYAVLAALLDAPSDARLRRDFEAVKTDMGSLPGGADDVQQLNTALAVFSRVG